MIPVLCINDSEINLFLHKRMLLLSGITDKVICLHDGQQALDYYAKLRSEGGGEYPDLVILDIHMPNVDGWDFLDEFIRSYLPHFPKTRVIINSSTVDEEEIKRAKRYPIVIDFLTSQLTTDYLKGLELPAKLTK
jgi:CheY-like chemotaxis protein